MCYHFFMIKNSRIIRYIFSGGIAVVANLTILHTLVDIFHVWYLTSTIIAFCFGIIISYFLQKFFTFKDNSTKNLHLQFSIFLTYNLAMLGVNTLLMYIFVDIIGSWYFSSQIIITICTAFINYAFFNKVLFSNIGTSFLRKG